jgi:hypothetical protein
MKKEKTAALIKNYLLISGYVFLSPVMLLLGYLLVDKFYNRKSKDDLIRFIGYLFIFFIILISVAYYFNEYLIISGLSIGLLIYPLFNYDLILIPFFFIPYFLVPVVLALKYSKYNDQDNEFQTLDFVEFKRIIGIFHEYEYRSTYVMVSEKGELFFSPFMRQVNIRDIVNVKVMVDADTYPNLGSTFAGGLLMGGIGAVMGSLLSRKKKIHNLALQFIIEDVKNPIINFEFINRKTSIRSKKYIAAENRMQELIATLAVLEKQTNDSNR